MSRRDRVLAGVQEALFTRELIFFFFPLRSLTLLNLCPSDEPRVT